MTAIQFLSAAPSAQWLRQRVYDGAVLVLRDCPPARQLVDYFTAELEAAFAPHDPPVAQFSMADDAWDERARELRARYKRDPRARALMTGLLGHLGLGPERTAADVLNLRCQPHADRPREDPRHTLGAHRDTWASNVYQQINWWLPVYPVTPGRTIALLPRYWHEPIANDSAEWDLRAVRAELRAARAEGREPAVRQIPEPTEPPDAASSVPLTIEPGDVLVFSGAHLHASVPNASGATRFSLEMRTVDLPDIGAGRSAPNIDGAAPAVAWGWFRRLDSGTRLAETDVG